MAYSESESPDIMNSEEIENQKINEDLFKDENGNSLIAKQIDPSIYGFSVEKLDNFIANKAMKCGYTTRIVGARMEEWRQEKNYEELALKFSLNACFDTFDSDGKVKKVYFKDYSVHKGLEKLGYIKTSKEVPEFYGTKVSKEFYMPPIGSSLKPIDEEVLKEVFDDIVRYYGKPDSIYDYYDSVKAKEKAIMVYAAVDDFKPRKYQAEAVEKLASIILKNKELNDNKALLMAPTRSGKSYIIGWTMKEIFAELNKLEKGNRVAVIVTGKVDVKNEHQRVYQGHKDFGEIDPLTGKSLIKFLDKEELSNAAHEGFNAIDKAFDEGYENAVVFLSLQDLAGSTKSDSFSKIEHKQLINKVDLVIYDESHFGFYGKQYSKALQQISPEEKDYYDDLLVDNQELDTADEAFEENFKSLNPSIGSIYVSATPYDILLNAEGFSIDSNVVLVDPASIEDEAEQWLKDNPDVSEENSPYYGIPLCHSYGLNLGVNPSDVFGVKNNSASDFNGGVLAKRYLGSLFGIEGYYDKAVPSFFKNTQFKESGGGQNIALVFPRKRSADLAEEFLVKEGLSETHEILNISSLKGNNNFSKMSASQLKDYIANSSKPTITITVGRMTTGVSVPKWDTIVLLIGGESIQLRQQIMGRVNTPRIETIENENKKGKTIRICKKQNTHVIDFSASALYEVRETTDALYTALNPNRRKRDTLTGGPIFNVANDAETVKLVPLKTLDVRGIVLEELSKSPIKNLAKNTIINSEAIKGLSALDKKNILNIGGDLTLQKVSFNLYENVDDKFTLCSNCRINEVRTSTEENNDSVIKELCSTCVEELSIKIKETDEIPEELSSDALSQLVGLFEKSKPEPKKSDNDENSDEIPVEESEDETLERLRIEKELRERREEKTIKGKIKLCLISLYFYVMLSPENSNEENSLESVLDIIANNDDRKLLASHVGLDIKLVNALKSSGVLGLDVDNKIFAINKAGERKDLSPLERLELAMNGLRGFSDNEIATPEKVVDLILDNIGKIDASDEYLNWISILESDKAGIIDPASKTAVFLIKAQERMLEAIEKGIASKYLTSSEASLLKKSIRNKLWATPTSSLAYEVIKKVYREFGWNLNNIIWRNESPKELKANWAYAIALKIIGKLKLWSIDAFDSKNLDNSSVAIKTRSHIDKLGKITKEEWEEFEDFVMNKLVLPKKEEFKFDAAVGNPPYQDPNDEPIYHLFQEEALKISQKTSMIYLARWLHGDKKAASLMSLTQEGYLRSINYFSTEKVKNVFEGLEFRGGICIVCFSKEIKENFSLIIDNVHNVKKTKELLNYPIEYMNLSFLDSLMKKEKTLFGKTIKGTGLTGTEIQKLNPIEVNKDEEIEENRILVYLNASGSKGGKSKFYSIETPEGHIKDSLYAVCMRQSLLENNNRKYFSYILPKGCSFGRSSIALFKGAKAESENFLKYSQTAFFEFLIRASLGGRASTFLRYTPDLEDYTDNNPLFKSDRELGETHEYYGLSLDERLYKKFKLTDEEIETIENS